MYEDLARERYRRDERRARHAVPPSPGAPAMVVKVFQQTTLPTTTGVFYACHPCTVFGAEAEGGTYTVVADTSKTVYVYVVGSKAPSAGDCLVARFLGNRWVAERMGHSGTTIFTVTGCAGGATSGASVTGTLSGSTVASGTTDGSGHFSFSSAASTTYGYSITESSGRFATATGTVTTNVNGDGAKSVGLTAASGYACGSGTLCNSCNYPVPTTLFLTVGSASITLTWNALPQTWTGCSMASSDICAPANGGADIVNGGAGTTALHATFRCTGSPGFSNLALTWCSVSTTIIPIEGISATFDCSGTYTGTTPPFTCANACNGNGGVTNDPSPSFSCPPFSASGTVPSGASAGFYPVPGGGGSWTVTE